MSPKEFATKIATDGGEPDVYDLARAYLELYENWDALRANNGHYPHVNKQQAEIIGKLKSLMKFMAGKGEYTNENLDSY